MGNRVRLVVYGFLVWLVPFLVAVVFFPTRVEWRDLFESIMAVTLVLIVTLLAFDYLRRVAAGQMAAGLVAGLAWMAISIVIDLPLMLSQYIGMSLAEYVGDIGVTYLLIPVITTGLGAAFGRAAQRA